MNISEIWIKKPIMTSLVMLGIAFFGFLSYKSLPINNLPNISFPTIQVTAVLPGASAEQMASNVATPLEKQFSSIDGLQSMNSANQLGSTAITLQFGLNRNIDAIAQDVNNAIVAAGQDLPKLPQPPTFKKINPADQPVLYYALTSETLPLSQVNDYAEVIIAQNLSTLDGVAQVQIMGGQKYAVRVQVDPNKLYDRNIGINEVVDTVIKGNVNLPGGTLDSDWTTFTIEPKGQIARAKNYNPLIISYNNGYPVRISDVGQAIDSIETTKAAAWYVTKNKTNKTILLAIKKQPGANAVKVADEVKATMPYLQKLIPKGVTVSLVFDDSDFVKESIEDVQFTLVFTILIVIAVIFLFLKTFRPTIVPSLAIILSLLSTFIVMKLLNFSLDNLSLMAMTLCVGLVVDDAIVVLENILRHVEEGSDVLTATFNGSKEIGFTIVSMTTSLVVVFIPLLFMSGIIGRLFNEFAVCIAVAITMSGIISLTFTPMISSLLISNDHNSKKESKFGLLLDVIFNYFLDLYSKGLEKVIKHKFVSVLFVGFILIVTGYLFMVIPKGFMPSQDQNYFVAQSLASESFSFPNMKNHQTAMQNIVIKDPDVKDLISVAGFNGTNSGVMIVMTTPLKKRTRSVNQIIDDLRGPINSVPGVATYLMNPPPIQIGGMNTMAAYQYTLKSVDLDSLYKYTPMILKKLEKLPIITDVNTDLHLNTPKLKITLKRDKASYYGLTMEDVENSLAYAFAGGKISSIYATSNQYKVILELIPIDRNNPMDFTKFYLKPSINKSTSNTNPGTKTLVPITEVADIETTTGPLTVNHAGQLPSATISFNVAAGHSLNEAMKEIQAIADNILPGNVTGIFQGSAQEFTSSFASIGFLLIITILIIYMVLGILYESYLHPITILTALPPAIFGALFTLMIFGIELDMYSFVGLIMLIGIVKKNGIMMVDFAVEIERKENLSPEESIYRAAKIRFRPIMMTTMAAFFGTLPIAVGYGAGGDARMGLGLCVVGGLFFSQFITLFITPVFYIYLSKFGEKFHIK